MKTRYLSFALTCLLVVRLAQAQDVNTDYVHGTDFSKYKTYAWGPSQHPVQDQMWNQRIINDVDTQLSTKGLSKVDPGANPDLLVGYNAGIKQNVSWEGYRTGGLFMGGDASIQKEVENEGTLVVDLADTKEKTVLWRGMASETLSDKSDKNIKKLEKSVNKMFEKYPPKG